MIIVDHLYSICIIMYLFLLTPIYYIALYLLRLNQTMLFYTHHVEFNHIEWIKCKLYCLELYYILHYILLEYRSLLKTHSILRFPILNDIDLNKTIVYHLHYAVFIMLFSIKISYVQYTVLYRHT